jgi:hypothetical protein
MGAPSPAFALKIVWMSRWVLVALVCVAGMLVWVMATWPVPPEQDTYEEGSAGVGEPVQSAQRLQAVPPPAAASDPSLAPSETPEPLPEAPAAAEAQPESPEAEAEKIFSRENGPLAEYKAQFEKEPRDSSANEAEQLVRGAFDPKDSPMPVFRSVLCRETICRIEARVSVDTLGAYVAAMTRIVHEKFDAKLASERTSLAEAGEVSVTVYAKRPPATE